MIRGALPLWVALSTALVASAVHAQEREPKAKSLTLLFLGDNGGELAPCG